jgi:hypothetical protein
VSLTICKLAVGLGELDRGLHFVALAGALLLVGGDALGARVETFSMR